MLSRTNMSRSPYTTRSHPSPTPSASNHQALTTKATTTTTATTAQTAG